MDPRIFYCAPFFGSALFIFVVALSALRRRESRGSWYLVFICLAAALWASTEGMLFLGLDAATNLLITYVQYLGIAPLPPLVLLFALTIFGFEAWVTRKRVAALLGIAALIILLVWTNDLHHLVYGKTYPITSGPFPMLGLEHGVLWWLIIVYHYTLVALLSLLLIRQVITATGFHTTQAAVILVAVVMVWIANLVYITGNSPVPNMDISSLAFVLVALSIYWGFFRYNLLEITPIARSEIFSRLASPILVLDRKDRIVDINPAAEALFEIRASEAIGKDIARVLNEYPQLLELPEEARPHEACFILSNREHFFELHISLLRDRRGKKLGRLILMHDTTVQKCAAETLCATEKLQGVYEMAGAVCHELNQPLMAISGYAELIALKTDAADPLYADVQKLSRQIERMGRITQKLMQITRYETKDYLDRKIIDIEKSARTPGNTDRPEETESPPSS